MAFANLLSLVTVALAASAVEAVQFTPTYVTPLWTFPSITEIVLTMWIVRCLAPPAVVKLSRTRPERLPSTQSLSMTSTPTKGLLPGRPLTSRPERLHLLLRALVLAKLYGSMIAGFSTLMVLSFGSPMWRTSPLLCTRPYQNSDSTPFFLTFLLNSYKAYEFPAEVANLRAVVTKSGVNFVVSAMAEANGGPMYVEPEEAPLSSAKIYDSIWVRHWDTWMTEQRSALFSGSLAASGDKYTSTGELKNLLAGTKNLESPYLPFGGVDHFDLSPDGATVAFMSKAPELPIVNKTASYIYVVPHDGSSVATAINSPTSKGTPKQARGASTSPQFSPDSKSLAYVQMDEDNYESDKNILYTTKIGSGVINTLTRNWDRSVDTMKWTPDGKTLVLQVADNAREKLFTISASSTGKGTPKAITSEGYVGAYNFIENGSKLLLTNNSMISSNGYYIAPLAGGASKPLLEPYKIDTELAGLADNQVDEFYYAGANQKIHGLIMKPIGFDPKKKYPLAFLIHGGPQSAWFNNWSTRWNPAVFANQGYVAVMINPTGSLSYGQKLTDDIQGQWGGYPFKDLQLGFEYLAKTFKYIDTKNAIAAGASYGGYMVNWIQGSSFGRKFKALVCHDGVFSTLNQYATEELFFMQHEYEGTLISNYKGYSKWNPAAPERLAQWATPELVIHNDLDFRLPVSEGIAMFNILQEQGVPSKFLNFEDENHWVLKPENSLVWQREVLGWINKWSGVNSGKAAM